MEEVYIFGHKNPDTDSIVSAIVLEKIEKSMGMNNVKACRIGNINKETRYALNYFNAKEPEFIEKVEKGQKVMLVDHNGFDQSANGIENAEVIKVIDHHNVAETFKTAGPLFYMAMPYGCNSTILADLCKTKNITIDKEMAGLMLSAIISDTLLFNSPTCTEKDKEVAEKLAQIAEVDINKYGLDMLKAGTDLSDFSPKELINIDSKTYSTNGVKYQVAQVNTASIEDVLTNKEEIEKAINTFISDNSLDLFTLLITDIIENNSQIIVLGNQEIAEKAFNVKIENNTAFLPGVVSRKKQVVPNIDKVL